MFTTTLLAWYDEHQRSLPWRGEQDPYKVWVSEIILQQTRVQQGWDYYLRFISTFPTVKDLAEAQEEKVLRVWQGLGYYTRARNMHIAAQQIMSEHHGVFPNNYLDIRNLKGVGDYTAAAIGSIAFQLPYPAVDGNVLRIISRIFGIHDDIASPKAKQTITQICQQWIPHNNPGNFNQACMEFGAVWCTPKNPQCEDCPFRTTCFAFQNNKVELLPIKKKSAPKRNRYFIYTLNLYNEQILIEKRSNNDIWKNMYQFPLSEVSEKEFEDTVCFEESLREVLSHQIVHAKFLVHPLKDKPVCGNNQLWLPTRALKTYPFPKIMTEFFKRHPLYES